MFHKQTLFDSARKWWVGREERFFGLKKRAWHFLSRAFQNKPCVKRRNTTQQAGIETCDKKNKTTLKPSCLLWIKDEITLDIHAKSDDSGSFGDVSAESSAMDF